METGYAALAAVMAGAEGRSSAVRWSTCRHGQARHPNLRMDGGRARDPTDMACDDAPPRRHGACTEAADRRYPWTTDTMTTENAGFRSRAATAATRTIATTGANGRARRRSPPSAGADG